MRFGSYFIIIVLILGQVFLAGAPGRGNAVREPAVTMYGDYSKGLHIIFDLENSGQLYSPTNETIKLETPSQPINPWTTFIKDSFYVAIDEEGKNVVEFGKIEYHTVEGFRLFTFKRNGAGEKPIGCDVKGKIWAVNSSGTPEPIAERAYRDVIDGSGEKVRVLMHRLLSSAGKWIGDMGGQIVEEQEDGKVNQIGWCQWRVITLSDGKITTILMTRGMESGSKWSGRYQGVLYQDK